MGTSQKYKFIKLIFIKLIIGYETNVSSKAVTPDQANNSSSFSSYLHLKCRCRNGDPVPDSLCPELDFEFCQNCNPNYYLVDKINPNDNSKLYRNCVLINELCDPGFHLDFDYRPYLGNDAENLDFAESTGLLAGKQTLKNTISVPWASLLNQINCKSNICQCPNGASSLNKDCDVHGTIKCQNCAPGFTLVENRCVEQRCTCSNGVPAIGPSEGCFQTDTEKCIECFPGFYMKSDGQTTSCEACLNGYHYNTMSKRCEMKSCTCFNGNGKSGESCTAHEDEDCESCDVGFHLAENEDASVKKQTCQPNICLCDRGIPEIGDKCLEHNSHQCSTCYRPYKLTVQIEKSIGLIPLERSNEKRVVCEMPEEICPEKKYYDEMTDSCKIKVCSCTDGKPTTGDECEENGIQKCALCNYGFKLDQNTKYCVPNACHCNDGYKDEINLCPVDGGNWCSECSTGYKLYASKNKKVCKRCAKGKFYDKPSNLCFTNVCSCENGNPAVGVKCTKNSDINCDSCSDGYKLVMKSNTIQVCELNDKCPAGSSWESMESQCRINSCGCMNGHGTNGIDCIYPGDEDCMACDDGHHLVISGNIELNAFQNKTIKICKPDDKCPDGSSWDSLESQCKIHSCQCENGYGTSGIDCIFPGDEDCLACDDGLHLVSTGSIKTSEINKTINICKPNECVCDNGYTDSSNCPKHNAHWCYVCLDDFKKTATRNEIKCVECPYGEHYNQETNTCDANLCHCDGGVVSYGLDCHDHEAHSCFACDDGLHLVATGSINTSEINKTINICKPNDCVCDNGYTDSSNCPKHNAHWCHVCLDDFKKTVTRNETKCVECPYGEHYNQETNTCDANLCYCDDGVVSYGPDCHDHEAHSCFACDDGLHLVAVGNINTSEINKTINICKPNECVCDNGYTDSSDCPKHNAHWCHVCLDDFKKTVTRNEIKCAECPYGEHYNQETNTCDANLCYCDGGVVSYGPDCHDHEAHSCKSCGTGYHTAVLGYKTVPTDVIEDLDLSEIRKNQDLVIEDARVNSTIDEVIKLPIYICKLNKCNCDYGNPTTGESCAHWISGQPNTGCEYCIEGYHLEPSDSNDLEESRNQLSCRKNKCSCGHGTPSSYCLEHLTTSCQKCSSGYHLEDNVCVLNVCICAYGLENTGIECREHNTLSCFGDKSSSNRLKELEEQNEDLTDLEVMERFRLLCESSADCSSLPHSSDNQCMDYDLLDGVQSIGVGFDGTKDYNLESRRKILLNHDCSDVSGFSIGDVNFAVPGSLAVESNFESKGSTRFFESLQYLKQSKAEQANIAVKERVFSELDNFVNSAVTESGETNSQGSQSWQTSDSSRTAYDTNWQLDAEVKMSGAYKMVAGSASGEMSEGGSTSGTSSTSNNNQGATSQYSSTKYLNDRKDKEASKTNFEANSNNVRNEEVNSEETRKTTAYIAEMQFNTDLYSLHLNLNSHKQLNPKFLREFLLLPSDIFTIRSAEKYQRFIESYGTHVIVGSSFGGSFAIQMISSSTSHSSFEEFKESSQMEIDSMKGTSLERASQVSAAIGTSSGDTSSSQSSTSSATTSDTSSSKSKSAEASIGVGFVFSASGSVSRQDSSSNSAASENESSSASTDSKDSMTQNSDSTDTGLSQTDEDSRKINNDKQKKSATARDNMSKSKTTRITVNGGIELGFTQKIYTEEFPEEFDKWIKSVSKDPKSFNFVTRPIADLLQMSAFDFFPSCAMQCAFGAHISSTGDESCTVLYNDEVCSDEGGCGIAAPKEMTIKCKEFNRITSELERKRNVLEDAINLYLSLGKLTPIESQLIDQGPGGCTNTLFDIFFEGRELLSKYNSSFTEIPSMSELRTADIVKVEFKLPNSLIGFTNVKNALRESRCNLLKREHIVYKNEVVFLKWLSEKKKWIECDRHGNCDSSKSSVSSSSEDNLVCYKMICFEYDADEGVLVTNDQSLAKLDQMIEKEKTNKFSIVYKSEENNVIVQNFNSTFENLAVEKQSSLNKFMKSCTNEMVISKWKGNTFITDSVYEEINSMFDSEINNLAIVSTITSGYDENSNTVVDKYLRSPKPFFCNVNWHDAQRFELKNENQCLSYGLSGTPEYFLAVSNSPTDYDSMIYIHHDETGICVHGLNINSHCNYENPSAKLNTKSEINNNLYLCLNYTITESQSILKIKIGVTETSTLTNIKGEVIMERDFISGEKLESAWPDVNLKRTQDDKDVFDTLVQMPKYYAFAAGEHQINIRRLRVLQFLQECEAGHYDDSNGKKECQPCPVGFYQPDKGKTLCHETKKGYYQSKEGQSEQIPCEKGTYTDQKGSAGCKRCSPHKFPVQGNVKTQAAVSESEACYGTCDFGKVVIKNYTVSQTIVDNELIGKQNLCDYCENGEFWEAALQKCEKCEDNTIHDYSSNGCKSCPVGFISFEKIGSGECIEERTCSCDKGDAKTGLECPRDADLMCDKCDDYYHQVQITDAENDSGYKFDPEFKGQFYRCEINECGCTNGNGVIGSNNGVKVSVFSVEEKVEATCDVHNSYVCQSCNETAHYLSDELKCELKECQCDEQTGIKSIGSECGSHQEYKCQSCFNGRHLNDDNECLENKCECLNGNGSVFENCSIHGENDCMSCDHGYNLNKISKTCDENVCVCKHGTGTRGPACFGHGKEVCDEQSCDVGFKFVVDQENSQSSKCIDKNCQLAGQHFDEILNICVQNMCKCPNGQPETGTHCDQHGEEECDTCDAGYQRNGDKCKLKVCVCNHGTPVSSKSCTASGTNECSECHIEQCSEYEKKKSR